MDEKMDIGILTGGGDCPGLNSAIRAIVRRAHSLGSSVVGFRDGWRGVLDRDAVVLTVQGTDDKLAAGGTLLGSSRTNPMRDPNEYERVLTVFDDLHLDGLIAIGGDDTLSVAGGLAQDGKPVVGIPKTIDNDVVGTEACIGFDTAAGTVAEAVTRVRTTASSHHLASVVEVMGREAGWLAAVGGIAGGADYIVVPERSTALATLVEHINNRVARGLHDSVIVAAEGATIEGLDLAEAEIEGGDQFGHVMLSTRSLASELAGALAEALDSQVRETVLGYIQRGGSPSPFDRVVATRYGVAAVDFIVAGNFGQMAAYLGGRIEPVPLIDIAGKSRTLDPSYFDLLTLFV